MYTEECIQTFLEKQEQLFDEPVQKLMKKQRNSWRIACLFRSLPDTYTLLA